jgi:hypothetical protein
MFGSDWPVCTLSTSPKEWLEVIGFITRNAEEDQRLDSSLELRRGYIDCEHALAYSVWLL